MKRKKIIEIILLINVILKKNSLVALKKKFRICFYFFIWHDIFIYLNANVAFLKY